MNQPGMALARYGNVKVMTASPADQIVMLYDALFRFLREAAEASRTGDRARMGQRIGRGHSVLACLLTSLDRSFLPKLCDDLEPLYGFCMRRILEASLKNEPAMLDEIITILLPLRLAWAQAAAQLVRDQARSAQAARVQAAAAR